MAESKGSGFKPFGECIPKPEISESQTGLPCELMPYKIEDSRI